MQTTMLIDVENYRVLLLGAFRPREKYFIFFRHCLLHFRTEFMYSSPCRNLGSDMSEPGGEGKIIVKKCSEKKIIKGNEK